MKRLLACVLFALPLLAQPSGSGPYPANRFIRKTSDPVTCQGGAVEYNTGSDLFKGCGPDNSWSIFSRSILAFAAWSGDITGPSALTTTTGAGKAFTNQPANDAVEIVSSSAADTTQSVTIIGTIFGTDTLVADTVALNGTTVVSTPDGDWGLVLAVKLSASCAGTVTVREASGNATITTLATTVLSKGVETVLAANQSAWNRTVNLAASGATTKQLGLKGTNSSGTVIYDSQALTGATSVLSNSAFVTVTEIYTGDLEVTRTATETATKGTKLDGAYIATVPTTPCSAGDFLTGSSGNGPLTCGTPTGGGITGSGTLNTIPRITNATGPVIGNSGLTDNGTLITASEAIFANLNGTAAAPALRIGSGGGVNGWWSRADGAVNISAAGHDDGEITDGLGILLTTRANCYGFTGASTSGSGPDVCTTRLGSGRMAVSAGGTGVSDGWVVDSGHCFVTADQTNATTTPASTTCSVTVKTGLKYVYRCTLRLSDSVAADGASIDFDGGSATATNFTAATKIFSSTVAEWGYSSTTALATDVTSGATLTGASTFEVTGSFEPSSNGTFIPRFFQSAHSTGTLTLARGSHCLVTDTP